MTVLEFGSHNQDVLMLLHGGGLSWWNYRDAAALLSAQYHVVLPVLDGHADSDAPFTSIEDNADRILTYIDTRFGGHITALAGLSLGGQIAAEVLSRRQDVCRYALLESTLVKPMPLTHALIRPTFAMSYGLIRQKWFAALQAAYLKIPKNLFADYYRDTCKIRQPDMISFLEANSAYRIKPSLSDTRANVRILAGSRELKIILDSAKLLHRAIPGSDMEILPGLSHGELSICYPGDYARILTDWIEGDPHDQ